MEVPSWNTAFASTPLLWRRADWSDRPDLTLPRFAGPGEAADSARHQKRLSDIRRLAGES